MPDKKSVSSTESKGIGMINLPLDAKISPDIEDRRDWGTLRNAIGQQKQDFLDYWRDVRTTYPDIHTAYKVLRDGIMKDLSHSQTPNQVTVSNPTQPPSIQIGATKKFNNGTIGIWDGHGWRAKK